MTTSKTSILMMIAALAAFSACTVSKTPAPPLQGPSVLGLGLVMTASPDVLSMDGASQSAITITARDSNGQAKSNVQLRTEILANGSLVDFGSLSARTVTTGADGVARVIYTAPMASSGSIPSLAIWATPVGSEGDAGDSSNAVRREVTIRLVPPGVIAGNGPTARFTVNPAAPAAFTSVLFDASTSSAPAVGTITSYSWDFGDGSKATGTPATHQFTSAASFNVTLTVTDSNGAASTTSKIVTVSAGVKPAAAFTTTPASPYSVNQQVFFDGSTSTAGAGHSIVKWDWDFGTGATASGVSTTKSYDTVGTYLVTLTVTDEAGQTGIKQSQAVVQLGNSGVTAQFTINPTPAAVGQVVTFDASKSSTTAGATILHYQWNFNDGSPIVDSFPTTGALGTITHTFALPAPILAPQTISLTVIDSNGVSSSISHTMVIQ